MYLDDYENSLFGPFDSLLTGSKVRGKNQEFLFSSELATVDPVTTTLVMGTDKRVYEKRHGLIDCLAPAKPDDSEPKVYVDKVDWSSFPHLEELAWLFDDFFSRYDREVLMLIGKKRIGGGWLYYVPEQVGTGSSIEWEADDEEMDWFQDQATWVGTIHIHPGDMCSPSQTDIDDWAEPEKSGLHVVLGQDGSFTINGAIAGKTFLLSKGNLQNYNRWPVEHVTSKGRTLEELLKKPKPKPRSQAFQHDCSLYDADPVLPPDDYSVELSGEDHDAVHFDLISVGAVCVKHDKIRSLRVVTHQGRYYILTVGQYVDLVEECGDMYFIPKARRLRIQPVKGGK